MESIVSHLAKRGFIDTATHPDLNGVVNAKGKVRVYCGFDPTAESLHLGNLVGLMGLAWFRKAGHDVVAVIGGATGMIGDPSGKHHERSLLQEEVLSRNVEKISEQVRTILERVPGEGDIQIANNRDWYQGMSCIDFLRDVGKHFRVGVMLSKESVRARMQSEEGISYTEFSYQVLQGHDFYHLFTRYNTLIQIGGSDQWGNITAGTEYIRKLTGKEAYGITFPLIVKSDGQKFGKSEKGAVWLSKDLLSEYDFYQYLFRVQDSDVLQLMRMLTFIDMEEIAKLQAMMEDPSTPPNHVQKILAQEVTKFVHGEKGLEKALQATHVLMPGHNLSYTKESIESMAQQIEPIKVPRSDIVGKKAIDAVMHTQLLSSKSEVRRLIKNGGLSMNGKKIESDASIVTESDCIEGKYIVYTIGKKQRAILQLN